MVEEMDQTLEEHMATHSKPIISYMKSILQNLSEIREYE